ncbi:Anti-sigma-E factor RseA [Saliniradius amylolyticus]|uniref:Anti-sigma-E factor RseA n=1 Tax=Saliniradius amylolyticus TaxID=2183582 RepID=A0A2S2E311_9ALTE|nr:sigma-E factor negative regulatory protein [Saliniradius amylolyticus]AWL11397.1 Anti-sigma-E factor RseA [Saliniradius amylolyticus]
MTQQQDEHLSAMMDGEHGESTFVDRLYDNAELAGKWRRYHLIRDGLRKELPPEMDLDFSAKVAEAIDQEPAIVAPKSDIRQWPVVRNLVPLVRSGGQFAIAASVAAATIFGVQQLHQPQVTEPFNTAPTLGAKGGLSPVSLEQTRQMPNTDALQQKRRINAYMTDHQRQMRLKAMAQQTQQKDPETQSKTPQDQPR